MKYAADFRSIARNVLKGKWTLAVIAGMIASLLGAVSSGGTKFNFEFTDQGANFSLNVAGQQIYNSGAAMDEQFLGILVGGAIVGMLAVLALAIAFFFVGSVVELGYARFNLDLLDRKEDTQIGTLFNYFSHWSTALASRFLRFIYVFLWSLLLVIPGIIAGLSYAMTGYILAENPKLSASEAISCSKQIMRGNRFRLFCLEFSFIGWDLLCMLTFGIGYLWLTPYKQAATAAFYREISEIVTNTAPCDPPAWEN